MKFPTISNLVASEFDDRARALLGAWVSELDPDLFIGPGHLPIGIRAKGSDVISVTLAQCAPQFVEGYP